MALSDWILKPEQLAAHAALAADGVNKLEKPHLVARSAANAASAAAIGDLGYTLNYLREMDRLLRELAKFEGWTASELEQQLDERRRMAAVNVPGALQALREAVARCESILPEKPKERAKIVLCRLRVIEGGKSRLPTKAYDLEPEAA